MTVTQRCTSDEGYFLPPMGYNVATGHMDHRKELSNATIDRREDDCLKINVIATDKRVYQTVACTQYSLEFD
jgi:hypothetical protein